MLETYIAAAKGPLILRLAPKCWLYSQEGLYLDI